MATHPGNPSSGWTALLAELSQQGRSVAIGVFSLTGDLLEANPAMCYFMAADPLELRPKNRLINPSWSELLSTPSDGLVFSGLLTIGNSSDVSYGLNAKIFQGGSQILVYAEADIAELFEENKKMSVLNQEINNLQRQLIKEKNRLQATLAELRETQQMLIHSEKMNALGKLVAGVAHEINNPMAFVYSNLFSLEKSFAEVLQTHREMETLINACGGEELIARVAEILQRNDLEYLVDDVADMTRESKVGIERVQAIVEDLRRFSRLDEASIKEIDLIENLRSTVAIARAEIARKELVFSFCAPAALLVECCPGQLNQAILNVLINAVDAVEIGGEITVSVRDNEDHVVISVKDNGCGIAEEIKGRIFEPFFTTKPVGSGTGLGLSITYKIVHEMHQGSVTVNSTAGQGAEFMLSIPKRKKW